MDIAANLAVIRQRIATAEVRSGRPAGSVTLMGVSKGQSADAVREAADAGLELFGENRVQEAKIKIGQCPGRLRWHMIGHLQSNKCRDAVHFFEMIESVDSLELAEEIDRCAAKAAKTMPILIEVNIAGEGSKFGYSPDRLLEDLAKLNALRRIEIHGLMAVPPWAPEPEKSRVHFRRLRELKTQCDEILGAPLPHLSMGMSGDYEIAVEEGATIVRVGTALFGARKAVKKEANEQF